MTAAARTRERDTAPRSGGWPASEPSGRANATKPGTASPNERDDTTQKEQQQRCDPKAASDGDEGGEC